MGWWEYYSESLPMLSMATTIRILWKSKRKYWYKSVLNDLPKSKTNNIPTFFLGLYILFLISTHHTQFCSIFVMVLYFVGDFRVCVKEARSDDQLINQIRELLGLNLNNVDIRINKCKLHNCWDRGERVQGMSTRHVPHIYFVYAINDINYPFNFISIFLEYFLNES